MLRPGRIDRKIKVGRPGKEEAAEILRVYLTPELPLDPFSSPHRGDKQAACGSLISQTVDAVFRRTDDTRLLSIRLRSGQHKILYRGDLVSGAILASIVQRAKERAIERTIAIRTPLEGQLAAEEAGGAAGHDGLTVDDLLISTNAEFREGEMQTPDDAAEEWLKLLDHHPEQVVGFFVPKRASGRGAAGGADNLTM